MDSTSHNILQFVSAAAQVIKEDKHEGDKIRDSSQDLSYSTDGITWNIPDLHRSISTTIPEQSDIQQQLAEATGIEHIPTHIAQSEVTADVSIEEGLQTLFRLPSKERVTAEWPCYIVQSAIVSGCMYSTDKHICFYAALPESQLIENKFGYLLLKKKGSKYERYFFDIKGDILAWYESSADTYSPIGKIDLKYVLTVRQSNKKKFGIKIVSMDKTWYLQADTNAAVIEWTNALQKAVFRAKNKGSSLKIKLPFENILDIEQTEAFEFQRFLKIRAVGIDDSFVVDEYYFAYFNDIEATFNQLIDTWQNYTHHPVQDNSENHSPSHSTDHSPSLSISDLYDADSQPIVIQSANRHAQTSSVVANALSVPAALKDFLYPSHSKTADIQEDSSDSEEEDQRFGWLYDKHRSGMKMVYGLLSGSSGSTAVALDDEDNEEEDGCEHPLSGQYANEAEIVDERTLSNFQKYFVLPESEKLLTVFRCSLLKTLPCYGKLYISTHYISFNSKGFATKAKIIIPFTDVIRIQKIRTKGYIFHSLSIVTHNKKEIFLEFSSITRRNGCFARLFLQHKRVIESQNEPEKIEQNIKAWETRLIKDEMKDRIHNIPKNTELPIISRVSTDTLIYKKPEKPLHFTCITIGTRGDVQPYIALCKGLMKEGHRCRIATHEEFKDWIEEHGIEFRNIGGDPSELMRICVENNFFSVNFVVEGLRLFKDWIDELLVLAWKAVQGTDILLESPSAMIGVHMAEALGVPYFRSFPMPMTRTRSFPHPFATPNSPKGRLYNDMTYVLFDHAIWTAIAARTNKFRQTELSLPPTTYEKLEVWKIPYLYSFSPSIVPSPLDWLDWIHCTGYWFLDNPQTGWKPDPELEAFLNAKDSRPIVYIGFGSIIVSDPLEIIKVIVESVLLSNVRAVVSSGWASRLNQSSKNEEELLLKSCPGTIFSVQSVPHDWLFLKIRAVVHHGGAGTTAAGLRAGKPTIIKPFFADQFFWGERVQEMGLGQCIKKLTVDQLSAALRIVSTDENMLKLATKVGEKIRSETGVETAIQCIYRDMELAKSRTLSSKHKAAANHNGPVPSSLEEDQEWTFIDTASSEPISPDLLPSQPTL